MYICIFMKELERLINIHNPNQNSELSEELNDKEEQLNQQEPKKAQEENIGRERQNDQEKYPLQLRKDVDAKLQVWLKHQLTPSVKEETTKRQQPKFILLKKKRR